MDPHWAAEKELIKMENILLGLITELAKVLGPWVLELSLEAVRALLTWAMS